MSEQENQTLQIKSLNIRIQLLNDNIRTLTDSLAQSQSMTAMLSSNAQLLEKKLQEATELSEERANLLQERVKEKTDQVEEFRGTVSSKIEEEKQLRQRASLIEVYMDHYMYNNAKQGGSFYLTPLGTHEAIKGRKHKQSLLVDEEMRYSKVVAQYDSLYADKPFEEVKKHLGKHLEVPSK